MTMTRSLLALSLVFLVRAGQPDHGGIDAFNAALSEATRNMDNTASIALWEDGGVSLLPNTRPIVGRKAIAKFFDDVTRPLAGAHMRRFQMECHDIRVAGTWASEWCTEHQVVQLPNGQPDFDGYGTMSFVLHKAPDGKWRLVQEMWTQGTKGD